MSVVIACSARRASQPNYASHGPIPLLEPCFEAIMRLEKARWGSASGCKTLANQPRHFLYTPGRRFLTAETHPACSSRLRSETAANSQDFKPPVVPRPSFGQAAVLTRATLEQLRESQHSLDKPGVLTRATAEPQLSPTKKKRAKKRKWPTLPRNSTTPRRTSSPRNRRRPSAASRSSGPHR